MKKLIVLSSVVFLMITTIKAQGEFKFGVTGGLLNTDSNIKLSLLNFNLANIDAINNTGFYVGAIADIGITNKLHIQPELTYGSAGDLSFIYVPVMAKYYIIPKLNIQIGPQFSFSSNLDEIKGAIQDIEGVLGTNSNLDDVLNSLGVDLGFGAGFDITNKFSVQARYALELTNRYSGPISNSLEIQPTTFTLGFAYFF